MRGGKRSAGRSSGASELARFRSLASELQSSDARDDSWLDYLRHVSGAIIDRFDLDSVVWDLERSDPAASAHAQRGAKGIDWTIHASAGRGTGPRAEDPVAAEREDPGSIAFGLGTDGELGTLFVRRLAKPLEQVEGIEIEIVCGIAGAVLVNRFTGAALRERVKELGCLYTVSRIAEGADRPFEDVLADIARALPEAWQYPDVAAARIELDGRSYDSRPDWREEARMSAAITVRRARRGSVHVVYRAPRPPSFEGPFLREERSLIEAIARELSGIVERREARAERAALEDQIRHADRLATIGQLAAGVAHELNEPLGAILGFSELLASSPELSGRDGADVRKIIDACLRARDIVNKLRLFARQTPPARRRVNLNDIVNEGLYFTEAQCARQRVRVSRDLDEELPDIEADAGQMHQLLTNLTVNAMQAMPDGGDLRIRTRRREREVALFVEDTGTGMDDEIRQKIFLPFFTTKPPEQGTGLGLSVVHGIVAGHGGFIEVDSAPGRGTAFEVRLPLDGVGLDMTKEWSR